MKIKQKQETGTDNLLTGVFILGILIGAWLVIGLTAFYNMLIN